MVAGDEVVVEEVVVGLADGLQQARALLLHQRAAVQPQRQLVQPLLCTPASCAHSRATRVVHIRGMTCLCTIILMQPLYRHGKVLWRQPLEYGEAS